MEVTGRYKIEIVPKLNLKRRHTQLYLVKQNENSLQTLNTFYKESLHPSHYDYVTCGHCVSDYWHVQNLQKYFKRHNKVELILIYRHKDSMKIQFVPHSSKNHLLSYKRPCQFGEYKDDIFKDVIGISLVYLKNKKEVKGIKRKLKEMSSCFTYK